MNFSSHRRFPILTTLFAVSLFFLGPPLFGGDVRVGLVGVEPDGRPRLEVSGPAGTNYTLEASTDLLGWWIATDELSTNGLLRVTHNAATNFPSLLYRGRTALPAPTVAVRAQTNWAVSTIATTNGGFTELWAPDGLHFTLTVPAFALATPALITMSRVTNIVHDGVMDSAVAAVKLEPEGLQFLVPALLEIQFPTNIDSRTFASFAFSGDGSEYHLAPDRLTTNTVILPITHFSGYQSRSLSDLEFAAAAAKYLKNARERESQDIAVLLDDVRRKGDDGPSLAEVWDIILLRIQHYYDNYLKPQCEAAKSNCDLFRFVSVEVMGLERQLQLLGKAEDAAKIHGLFGDFWNSFCPAMRNCRDEILKQCAQGLKSTEALSRLLTIERQSQLLGAGDCFGVDLEQLQQCAPEVWEGTLTYEEQGQTNFVNNSTTTTTLSCTYNNTISGRVRSVTEYDFGTFGKNILIGMQLTTFANYLYTRDNIWAQVPCEGGGGSSETSHHVDSISAAGTNNNYSITINLDYVQNQNTAKLASLSSTAGIERTLDTTYPGYCPTEAPPPPQFSSQTHSVNVGTASLNLSSPVVTTNSVYLELSGSRTYNYTPVNWHFVLDLKRQR